MLASRTQKEYEKNVSNGSFYIYSYSSFRSSWRKRKKEAKQEKGNVSEAIYCEVTKPDGTVVKCYFCDCSKLSGDKVKTLGN